MSTLLSFISQLDRFFPSPYEGSCPFLSIQAGTNFPSLGYVQPSGLPQYLEPSGLVKTVFGLTVPMPIL